jgi:multidrug efflux system outer membrane protein
MAPRYERPAAPVDAQWPAGAAYEETTHDEAPGAAEIPWRDFIGDGRLREVIDRALQNNRDLRIAALNVELTKAMYGISTATLLPVLNVTGAWFRERVPADLSPSGSAYTAEKFIVNLGMSSWEIDFFGRIRSLRDRALQEYLAGIEARRGFQIMLVSSVAQAWLALAADKEALKLVRATLEAQKESYRLMRKRYDVGMASEIDLRRIQSQMETSRAEVALYTRQVALDLNALNLLVGSPVKEELLPVDLGSVTPPCDFSPGVSSEVLLERPDVLAAERRLKAAYANIGAARAAFFPRITLTTSIGTASAELSGLFKSGSGVWAFAPQVVLPVFDARTWYAYRVTKVEREISIAQYEKAIQSAFREVADNLAIKGTIDAQITAQEALVEAVDQTYRLARLRYDKGIDSYLSVLDAQRSFYGARQALIMLRLARAVNIISLYKALGGGSDEASPE